MFTLHALLYVAKWNRQCSQLSAMRLPTTVILPLRQSLLRQTKPTWLSASTTINSSRTKVAGGSRSERSSSIIHIPLPYIAKGEEREHSSASADRPDRGVTCYALTIYSIRAGRDQRSTFFKVCASSFFFFAFSPFFPFPFSYLRFPPQR